MPDAGKTYQYSYRQRDKARILRDFQTDAEYVFWNAVRALRLEGHKFRRQHPIGRYVVDFCCVDSMLVVEIDGGQHCESQRDKIRDEFLALQGYGIVRFWNNDVLNNTSGVLQALSLTLSQRERGHSRNKNINPPLGEEPTNPPPPLGEGRGEGSLSEEEEKP